MSVAEQGARGAGSRSRSRPTATVALAIAGVAAIANAADFLLLDFFGPLILLPLALGTFAGVGLVIALRRPDHAVGWLFLVAGAFYALTLTLDAYSWRALVVPGGSLPGGEVAAWLTSFLWLPALGSTLVAIVLFPDGRAPSPRWRPVIGLLVVALSVTVVTAAFAPTPLVLPVAFTEGPGAMDASKIPNPFALQGTAGEALLAISPVTQGLAVPIFVVVMAAVVVRFRGSSGIERQQLKWFAFASSVAIAALALSFSLPPGLVADVAWGAGILSFGLVPVGAGIAILRYRLYDIDVVINRTLVYGAVVAVLAAVYVGLVVGLQAVLSGITGGQTLPVALSTLAIAALFGPVRARVRSVVDRRFYRSRYDTQRTVEALSARLRDEVEVEAVGSALVRAAGESVQPATAGLWLRRRGS